MKAQPGPMVSGSHFFPKAPLLWVKWMPAWAVMSRKVMVCAGTLMVAANREANTHHGNTEARRIPGRRFCLEVRITFGPRELEWQQLPSNCARLGRAGRPSPHDSWWRLRFGVWLARCSGWATAPICAREYSGVRCYLRG